MKPTPRRTDKESRTTRARLHRVERQRAKATLKAEQDGDAIERTRRTEGWHTW